MKPILYIILFFWCFTINAQFKLVYFDTKTDDILKLDYTVYHRQLADASGKYYESHITKFPDEPEQRTITFDKNGYVSSRKTEFNNNTYTYSNKYSLTTINDLNNSRVVTRNILDFPGNLSFYNADEYGAIVKDSKGRVIKVPHLEYPTKNIIITYDTNSYNVKEEFFDRTYTYDGKEIIKTMSGADYQYYKSNNAIELNVRVNYTYVSNYDFFVYEYDAKGNWLKKVKFLYNTGYGNDSWRLQDIEYRTIHYKDGSIAKPTQDIKADKSKYEAMITSFPIIDYNPQKNGYNAYLGKTDIQNLKIAPKKASTDDAKKIVTNDCLSGNCKDGLGRKTINKTRVEAIFSKSRLNSFGIQVFDAGIYKGEFSIGKRDGYGTYTWDSNGETHIGTWKDGLQDGFGIVLKGDDVVQAGEYKQGKYTLNYLNPYKAGTTKDNCVGNCYDGFGKITFNNGDWYLGFFNQGSFYKLGIYHFNKEDTTYWGTYENGKMHGSGQYVTAEYTYLGNFQDGKFNGKAIKFFKNGSSEAGRYENGSQVISYGKLD